MAAIIESWFEQDLKKPVQVQVLNGNVFSQDHNGNLVGVKVYDGGEPAALTGSVNAYCILADGTTVPVDGTRQDNMAYIMVPQSALAVPGTIRIVIKLTEVDGNDDVTNVTTLAAIVSTVYRTKTDTVITPSSQVISDWSQDIAAEIQNCADARASLGTIIAEEYSTTKTYAVGEYVMKSGTLYRCTTAVTTAGSWSSNSSKFTAVKLGADVCDLKSALSLDNGDTIIDFVKGYYITTNQETGATVSLSPVASSSGYQYAIVSCAEGDIFTLNGKGGNGPRLWAFIDSDSKMISKSGQSATATMTEIIAPANAAKLIVNFSGDSVNPVAFVGQPIGKRVLALQNTVSQGFNDEMEYSVTFTSANQNINTDICLQKGITYILESETDITSGYIVCFVLGDSSNILQIANVGQPIVFTPNVTGYIRLYNGNTSYTGAFKFTIRTYSNFQSLSSRYRMILTNADLLALTGGSVSMNDIKENEIVCFGATASVTGLTNYPAFLGSFGVCICTTSIAYSSYNGSIQIFITDTGIATRWKRLGTWTDWVESTAYVSPYAQYNNRNAWLEAFPSDKLADIPVNKIICIGSTTIHPLDEPKRIAGFTGNVVTISARGTLNPGAVQIAFSLANVVYTRVYLYRSSEQGGNYWGQWRCWDDDGDVYEVGSGKQYTSLTACLLDISDNKKKKTIHIYDGEYDMFAEYLAEIDTDQGRMTIPMDGIPTYQYMTTTIDGKTYWYNAFVPTNTKIIGHGNVVLKMMPTVEQLEALATSDTGVWLKGLLPDNTYTGIGASKTWSPLNIYGSVEIENITVKCKNARYCLHNDDHNEYPNSKQHYKNCRFLYEYSDLNTAGNRLGFNSTIGFGIQAGSTHIFEDCEIYMDSQTNSSAYYGHEGSNSNNGTLILRNCRIHSSNFSNNRVIRLQDLATSQGKVTTLFENCYINGSLNLDLYYTNSKQNFDVTFVNSNKVPVVRTIASGGTITDIYTVTWYNPLPTPTAENPLIETDTYTP